MKNRLKKKYKSIFTKKEFTFITITLLLILAVRFVLQLRRALIVLQEIIGLPTSLVFSIAYGIAFIGVAYKKRWGTLVAVIIGLTDFIIAIYGVSFFSNTFYLIVPAIDLVLIALALIEYKRLR